jgi:peptide/nickel transport system ATP-binding protein
MSQVQQIAGSVSDNGMSPLLEVSDLSVSFARSGALFRRPETEIKAVDRVSFEVKESEFLSFVGESGSGKSTIARCIMGLIHPTSGSIKFRGKEVSRLGGKEVLSYWREVQMIFQDPFGSLNPRDTVFQTIATPIIQLTKERNRSKIEETVTSAVQEVGLDPDYVMRRLPHQLSGGERQRVNVARALVSNPKLLIADEPVTMLDAAQRLNILSLLMDLKTRRKLTVVMITHDLASAKVTSDRTIVVYLGKIVEEGKTSAILSSPHHPYVELIASSTPKLHTKDAYDKRSTQVSIEESAMVTKGCVFRPRCKYATTICETTEPKLQDISPDHPAACHNPLNKFGE